MPPLPCVRRLIGLVTILWCSGQALSAQDVSYGPIEWANPSRAPDELPTLKSKPRFDIPQGLEKSPDIGYVVFDVTLDEKGRVLSQHDHPTLDA